MTPARDEYLQNEVMTAPPERLQLMLLDAATRHASRSLDALKQGKSEDASESAIRAQDIVIEILAGLATRRESPLAAQVAAVYNFIYRALVEGHLQADERRLQEAVRLLDFERETWRLVCHQGQKQPPAPASESVLGTPRAKPVKLPPLEFQSDMPRSGLSFEA